MKNLLIADLPKNLQFISDSQDVDPVKGYFYPLTAGYDSFFVETTNGKYTQVWGIYGNVPNLDKIAYRII